jgi:L-asparaginase II
VLVLDVSGSMGAYSRALVQFGFAAMGAGRKVEVFCFGTRLTRVTRQLQARDPDAALAEVAARARVAAESIPTCTDGCGVVAFELPLATIAAMYARLPDELPRQFAAMRAHPELVRGDGDLDTELMRALPGAVSKGGAEALASVGIAGEGLGLAVRVEDGGYRAIDPVVIETLRQVLGWESVPEALEPFAEPVVANFVGDRVVRLTARVELSTRAG